MAHHSSEAVPVTPEQVHQAQHVWDAFVHMAKITIIGIVVIVSLMAFFFIGLR